MKVEWSNWCDGEELADPVVIGPRNLSDDDVPPSSDASGAQPAAASTSAAADPTAALPPSRSCHTYPWRRVQSITSNLGYQMRFAYESETVPTSTDDYNGFATTQSVTAVNLATDYCDPASSTCTYSRNWPTLTYTARNTAGRQANTAYTDQLGRQWSVLTTYSDSGARAIEVRRPSSSTPYIVAQLASGTDDKVTSVRTPSGTWNYAWSEGNGERTVVVSDPLGRRRTVVSSLSSGLIVREVDALWRQRSYQRDAYGRVEVATLPDGDAEAYQYDDRGNVVQLTRRAKPGSGAADIVTTSSYPPSCSGAANCNLPTSSTDALGNVTGFDWDPQHGGLLSVTRPAVNGVSAVTRYTYAGLTATSRNASGGSDVSTPIQRLVRVSACRIQSSCAGTADEVRTDLTYAGDGNLKPTGVTQGAGDGSLSRTTTMAYDVLGNLRSVDGPRPGADDTTWLRYDAGQRLVGVVVADPGVGGPPRRQAQRVSYDADDRVATREVGTVAGTSDGDWSGFAPAQAVSSTYDGRGFKIRDITTAAGVIYGVTDYAYDGKGRPVCAAVRMNPAAWSGVTDACSLQSSGSQGPDRMTRTSYDELDRPIEVVGGYGTAESAQEMRVGFNRRGQVENATDANGNNTGYVYDGHGRLQRTTFPDGSYEELGYDAGGEVTSRRLRDGRVFGFDYDALGRLTRKQVPDGCAPTQLGPCAPGAATRDVYYAWDLMGHPLSARFDGPAGGDAVTATWDALGRQTGETTAMAGMCRSFSYQYDAAGNRVWVTHQDGVGFYYGFDTLNRPNIVAQSNGVAVANHGYDVLGRPQGVSKLDGGATFRSYDAASRLTGLSIGHAGNVNYTFGYNPAGQVTIEARDKDAYAWTGAANVDRSYAVNALNQYTSSGGVTLGYDTTGNLVASGSTTYGYDAENRLVSTSQGVALDYDPLGRLWRVTSTDARTGLGRETRFGWDGDALALEYDASGQVLRRYVHDQGADRPLIQYEGPGLGTVRTLQADRLGSIVQVGDASGNLVAINSYDEFGIPGAGNTGRFGYTGQLWLPEVGLYYYKARMYSPTLGRFMQTDPIGYADGMNWYGYVGGDPVNKTDPSGLAYQLTTSCPWVGGGTTTLSKVARLVSLARSLHS